MLGRNENGELGDGTFNDREIPTAVSGLPGKAVAVEAGCFHTCAVLEDGKVYCWGYNEFGQLGDGTYTQSTLPVIVSGLAERAVSVTTGSIHTCALLLDNRVQCWGSNYFGELGISGDLEMSPTPVEVTGLGKAVGLLTSGNCGIHNCVLTEEGVKCWGANEYSQLGNGYIQDKSTPVEVLELPPNVSDLAAGMFHTCAILPSGETRCWGLDDYGQLGAGRLGIRTAPVETLGLASQTSSVAAGYGSTRAVNTQETLQCWGYNRYGQLGNDSFEDASLPVVISLSGEVHKVSIGVFHVCLLTSSGALCSGRNRYGQLGNGTNMDSSHFVALSDLSAGYLDIAAGADHTCAISPEGKVKCWGHNGYGQLGDGTTESRNTPVEVSGLSSGVAMIPCGGYHCCAYLTSGKLVCWGGNDYGQLGNQSTQQSSVPVEVVGLGSIISGEIVSLGLGFGHTCASGGGKVACWGSNVRGQLGIGEFGRMPTPEGVRCGGN